MTNRPALDWQGTSEVVAGLVLQGLLSPDQVDIASFVEPYDVVVQAIRDDTPLSEIGARYAGALTAAHRAAEGAMDVLEPVDWVEALHRARVHAELAQVLREQAKKAEQGRDVDSLAISSVIDRADQGLLTLRPLTQVDSEEPTWFRTGWLPIDKHVGGLPDDCLSIIGGPPGVGKTSVAIKLAVSYALDNPDKRVLIYSLEITTVQLLKRLLEIEAENLKTKKIREQVKSQIWVSDEMTTVSGIEVEVKREAAKGDVGFVAIDSADWLVRGENSQKVVATEDMYISMGHLAKQASVPVVLIAQLNADYRNGPPKVNHIRWSRIAEAVARLIILIYNPRQIWADNDGDINAWPTPLKGKAHLIVGKSSFGTKHEGLGAIQLDWKGVAAWSDDSDGKKGGVWTDRPTNGGGK